MKKPQRLGMGQERSLKTGQNRCGTVTVESGRAEAADELSSNAVAMMDARKSRRELATKDYSRAALARWLARCEGVYLCLTRRPCARSFSAAAVPVSELRSRALGHAQETLKRAVTATGRARGSRDYAEAAIETAAAHCSRDEATDSQRKRSTAAATIARTFLLAHFCCAARRRSTPLPLNCTPQTPFYIGQSLRLVFRNSYARYCPRAKRSVDPSAVRVPVARIAWTTRGIRRPPLGTHYQQTGVVAASASAVRFRN